VTVLRIAGWSLAYLAATVALVGFCGVGGVLAWLGCMVLGLALPNRVVDVVASLRWRHVVAAWQWLDRR
jgi:hypothetical protein